MSKTLFHLNVPNTDDVLQNKPLKLVIHGPPASGKSTLARRLARRYGARHLTVRTVLEETLQELRKNLITTKGLVLSEPDEDREERDRQITSWEEQFRHLSRLLSHNDRRILPEDEVLRLVRTFLLKDEVLDTGYILDGYPKTLQQAKELFGQAAEKPSLQPEATGGVLIMKTSDILVKPMDDIGSVTGNASVKILPDYVISLEANDYFLCERIMRMSERDICGTHYDETNMVRRIAEFRINNTVENTVLNFFDQSGIHPILIDITQGEAEGMETAYRCVCQIFGAPAPGLGTEESEEDLLGTEEQKLEREQTKIERELIEQVALGEYQDKMEKWAETLDKLKLEEEKVIVAQSEPLRFYLMRHVFPILTQGLIEIAKLKPEDPVDFLAEYLFKENPEGRMFDPSFTAAGDGLLTQYKSSVESTLMETSPASCSKL